MSNFVGITQVFINIHEKLIKFFILDHLVNMLCLSINSKQGLVL